MDKQARLALAERSDRFSRRDLGGDDDEEPKGGRPTRADKKAKAAATKAAALAGTAGGKALLVPWLSASRRPAARLSDALSCDAFLT